MSDSRTIFIAGATSGFGCDASLALAERGHTASATMCGVEAKNAQAANDLGRTC
jgi:NAD(P)-dependent dehydrogenase (short-subunit alcohol dehydrogenase family)